MAKKKRIPTKTIVAVAIGNSGNNKIISTETPTNVRPYVLGLINRLKALQFPGTTQNCQIGSHYVIDYRECQESELSTSSGRASIFTVSQQTPADHVIMGMSTTVVRAASAFTYETNQTQIPVVGVVSNPAKAGCNAANICGISAKRINHARKIFDNFRRTITIPERDKIVNVYLLYKNFQPAKDAKDLIESTAHTGVTTRVVTVTDPTPSAIAAQITTECTLANSGLLILPADWFFAAAPEIIGAARSANIPDFWPVTDWVRPRPAESAFGGYGVPQQWCGARMGEIVLSLWKNHNAIPSPQWVNAKDTDAEWSASRTVANGLSMTLSTNVETVVP